MKRKIRGFFGRVFLKLGALGMVLLGLLILADMSFRPVVETINGYRCHEAVSNIINSAVMAELEREDTDYSKLVTLSTNSEGEIISVESNVLNINRLKTAVADRVEREIERLAGVDIDIPIGTLTGVQFLNGKGFNVGMSVVPLGYANTSIISEFSEAGINQTLHRIVIEIDAEVDAVIPGLSTRVPVSTSIVAAETVIVGRVPEAYTHVITDSGGSDVEGIINDYGA